MSSPRSAGDARHISRTSEAKCEMPSPVPLASSSNAALVPGHPHKMPKHNRHFARSSKSRSDPKPCAETGCEPVIKLALLPYLAIGFGANSSWFG